MDGEGGGGPNSTLDIQKLPETKTGIKLKQKLMEDLKVKAICEGKVKFSDMELEERSIIGVTNELFK